MKESYKLTQEQFEYVVEQCDIVLKKYAEKISIVGIAWLHVLNSHPANQVKYVYIFNKRGFIKTAGVFFLRTGIILADLLLSLFSVFRKTPDYKKLPANIDVLLISHLVNAKAKKQDPDFYYQDLPNYLQSKQYRTAIALLTHTKGFADWHNKEIEITDEPVKFLIPRRLGFWQEVLILSGSLSTAFFFLRQSFSETSALKKSFLQELAANALSVDTLRASRIHQTIRHIATNTNCKVISLTWEGHSWERLICHIAKTGSKKILSIGYQHTILFPSSYALKRDITRAYNPDIILTVGSVTKEIMETPPCLQDVIVKEYGSPRLATKKNHEANRPIKNGCLVAPEGLIDECIRLFSFAIETAKLMPGINFIFRTHPTLRFEDIQLVDIRLQNLPKNIIISSFKNMDDDFERCSWLLYRSSSVSFFAILAGLRPVYLQMQNELSIDPLYKLTEWRLRVTEPGEMASIIDNDMGIAPEVNEQAKQQAVLFSESYMIPYDVSVFEKCIKDKLETDR